MIIINDSPGQLCNRIWSYAPFIALALERKLRFISPYFGEYIYLFDDVQKVPRIHFATPTTHKYYRLLHHGFRLLRRLPPAVTEAFRIHIDRDNFGDEAWSPAIVAKRFAAVILSGWNQPKPALDLTAYRAELRAIFRPAHAHVEKVDAAVAAARGRYDRIVGVHVRRGDYRAFLDGRYFFDDSVYAEQMQQIATFYPNERVGFLICTNAPLSADAFAGLAWFQIPDPASIEDLYALERCDLIIGPPSTFSMWASFCGAVPLRIIERAGDLIDRAQFRRIVAFHTFEDGAVFDYPEECQSYLEKLISTR